jgi:hypothetical protein
MLALWTEYSKTVTGKYAVGWRKFFADGFHIETDRWRKKSVAASAPSTLTQADEIIAQRRSALQSRGAAN